MIWPFKQKKAATGSRAEWASSKETRETATALVSSFVAYIQAHPLHPATYRDQSQLPYPKNALINGFLIELAWEHNENRIGALINLGLLLAQFREQVGITDLAPMVISQDALDGTSDTNLMEMFSDGSASFDRWATYAEAYERDLTRLRGIFVEAASSNHLHSQKT